MNMRSKQRGVSFLSWALILGLVSIAALLAVRLIPPYIDYRTIVTLIEALPNQSVHTMSKLEVRDALQKRFLINNIRDLKVNDVVEIQKKREGTILRLHYEVRDHLLYNVYVVVAFDRSFNYQ